LQARGCLRAKLSVAVIPESPAPRGRYCSIGVITATPQSVPVMVVEIPHAWPSARSLAAAARLLIGIANAGTDMRLHSAAPATILMARAFMGDFLLVVVPVP